MYKLLKYITLFCATLSLTACASTSRNTDIRVHEINGLDSLEPGTGGFKGMEFLANPLPGELKSRVNIFYVHGIGWTENPEGDALANDFLAGVAKAYKIENYETKITSHCSTTLDGQARSSDEHILITSNNPIHFDTALPGSKLVMENLICMDRTVLQIDDVLEFAVYRVFWDDLFWNSLQYPHVGQDDDSGSSKQIAGLRRKYNRQLKDEIVTYGFSDAVMYLGPAGDELRRAVQGAMCSAALDASGHGFDVQGDSISYQDVCSLASYSPLRTNQFAFVTESLGSKITYDVMRETLSDGKDNALDTMLRGSEFYMLANQLPLLSLNDLSATAAAPISHLPAEERPRIIAMSELNDFLTYELIPFYTHLWELTDRAPKRVESDFGVYRYETAPESGTLQSRAAIADNLGFDVVDVRLEFANKLIPLVDSLVDPLQAHGGHASEPELMLLMLCGAVNGALNDDACLATELAQ